MSGGQSEATCVACVYAYRTEAARAAEGVASLWVLVGKKDSGKKETHRGMSSDREQECDYLTQSW